MRDNHTPARAIKDLCPLEGVLVPPKTAVDHSSVQNLHRILVQIERSVSTSASFGTLVPHKCTRAKGHPAETKLHKPSLPFYSLLENGCDGKGHLCNLTINCNNH